MVESGRLGTSRDVSAGIKRILLPAQSTVETSGFFSISRPSPLPYYVGKVPECWALIQWPMPSSLSNSLVLEESVSKDITALLTFVFQRRVTVAGETKVTMQGSSTTTFIPTAQRVDSRLYAPMKIVPQAIWDCLRQLLAITNERQFEAVTNAIRLYHSASAVAETDYSAAYLLLVSSVEALAATFERAPLEFAEWSEASRWNQWIVGVGLDSDVADKLRSKLIDNRAFRLRQRFIALGLNAATEEFWTLPWETCIPQVELDAKGQATPRGMRAQIDKATSPSKIPRSRIRTLLANVYDHRSALVHAGSPFPQMASLDFPMEIEFEPDPLSGKRKKVALPSFAWFERLVWFGISHCLEVADKDDAYTLPDASVQPARY